MKRVVMWVSVVAVLAFGVLNLTYDFSPKPDVIYQMCNQHIEWHYAGK